MSVNDDLRDAGIIRALLLHRHSAYLVQSVVGFLNDTVLPDLLGRITTRLERIKLRGFDSGVITTQRYAALLEGIQDVTDKGLDAARKLLLRQLRDLAKVESEWTRRTMQYTTPDAIGIAFEGLNMNAAARVVNYPVHGRPMEEWWQSIGADLQKKIETQVGIGLSTGETTDQIVARIRGTPQNDYEDGVLQGTRRNAEALVRTSANHVSSQAREETYAANSDVIKGIQWVSTLDTRTTKICRSLDGKVYDIGDGPRPPAHWNCRSTTIPITMSWKELGIKARDIDAGSRASMSGQVPASLTYPQWLSGQPADVRRAARSERPVAIEALE